MSIVYKLCAHYDRVKLELCLRKVGHINVKYQCKYDRIYCYYIAICFHRGAYRFIYDFKCYKIAHYVNYLGLCCTPSC